MWMGRAGKLHGQAVTLTVKFSSVYPEHILDKEEGILETLSPTKYE